MTNGFFASGHEPLCSCTPSQYYRAKKIISIFAGPVENDTIELSSVAKCFSFCGKSYCDLVIRLTWASHFELHHFEFNQVN